MTVSEFRKSAEYAKDKKKIENYSKGFRFTLHINEIPAAKMRALKVLTDDCIKEGILESVSFGLDINGNLVDETFERK